LALEKGERLLSGPGRFCPRGYSPPYPLYTRLKGSQSRSGRGGTGTVVPVLN